MNNILNELCDKYGSDKGSVNYFAEHVYPWHPHTYTKYYELIFNPIRANVKNVLEVGLGTNNTNFKSNMTVNGKPGASLRVWRDYFTNAEIIGCDIDSGVLFTENRINTYQLDQTNPIQTYKLLEQIGKTFDIIIDDGLHEVHAGYALFTVAYQYLNKNGYYIIEDVKKHDLETYKQIFRDTSYNVDYVQLHRQDERVFDNNLVVVTKA
jgi:hypothetical protein